LYKEQRLLLFDQLEHVVQLLLLTSHASIGFTTLLL
jgi:hypothetical protein